MTCQDCDLLQLLPVTLHNGKSVCRNCPLWRQECEAREVLRMSRSAQDLYLQKVEAKRGRLGLRELQGEIFALQAPKKLL